MENQDGPQLILVAHGTRSPQGVTMLSELTERVSGVIGPVQTAFVDVLTPGVCEVLDRTRPAIVVPAFLASGYHVQVDIPHEISVSGHVEVRVSSALGPDPVLAEVMLVRLIEAGWVPGDTVIMAAAGSSDMQALKDVQQSAGMLETLIEQQVYVGYLATASPTVEAVVEGLRVKGKRIFIASYLLVHGLFHKKLLLLPADGVAEPLGVHQLVVQLVVDRFAASRVM
ncbi:MAG: sirohydrochlorin chelatase [Mycobacteriaceae bacterium]